MKINELLPTINLEDYQVEFKRFLNEGPNPKTPEEPLEISWVKTIAGFANQQGGTLFVGVSNETHEIIPLGSTQVDQQALLIQRQIKLRISPLPNYQIKTTPLPFPAKDQFVLSVEVKRSRSLPVLTTIGKGISVVYSRKFGRTEVASSEEIRALALSSDAVSFDLQPTPETYDENDFAYLNQEYQKATGEKLTLKKLVSAGFCDVDGHLSRGALLFKDDCQDPLTLLVAMQIKGANKGANAFAKSEQFKGCLLKELRWAVAYVDDHSANGFEKTAERSTPLIAYPPRSLLEGIANAIGHRNYFMDGTQIEVNLYPDRLEIVSPGSLLSRAFLANERQLSSIPPMRRNKMICEVFSWFGIMDKRGSGFDKIEEDYHGKGDAYQPYASSDEASFTLVLPDLSHQGGLISQNPLPELTTALPMKGKDDLKICSFAFNGAKTASEIAAMLGITPSSYFRSNTLQRLVREGYLIEDKSSHPSKFSTNRMNFTLV